MNLSEEPADFLQIPDKVVLQLHLPTGLALAFQRLVKAHDRIDGKNADKAKQAIVDAVNELASIADMASI